MSLTVTGKIIRMIMIELRMFSYNFPCMIMSERYTVLKEPKQSFYSAKNPLIVNLKGKLQKPFDFILRCQKRGIWLTHLFVEIPRGFELPRNWSIQLR